MINIIAAVVIGLVVLSFWLLIAAVLALAVCHLWLDLKDRIIERRRVR
jgi:hypothetical protein